jgi:capsular polysaccharide export protein
LIRPCSLVFDDIGIYYDATQPSRLENLLKNAVLTVEQRQRAKTLIHLLIDLNISKYNVGHVEKIERPKHHHILLVVGQVEDDMSIQLGGVEIKTNLALLQRVREKNPNSFIIYKPHPDVQAGLRKGGICPEEIHRYADEIELNASILQCFEICDELHTITSQSGFEALIRGIPVHCYGLPFYAGWGLTQDVYQCSRRTQSVDLETLVYVTLVEYAFYNLAHLQKNKIPLVRPEDVIQHIKQQLDDPLKQKSSIHPFVLKILKVFKNRFQQ